MCYNRVLRRFLEERLPWRGVEYSHFHSLCAQLARKAGGTLPKYKGEPPPQYWSEELPLALMEAVETLGPQFDAVLVDEAQDFHNDWIDALMATLANPVDDPVWLFMDANQDIYGADLRVPTEFQPLDLVHNCRNTQEIQNEVIKRYNGPIRPEAIGPKGRPPEFIYASDQGYAVAKIVRRLVRDENVLPQDIAVLSAHSLKGSKVRRTPLAEGLRFSEDPPAAGRYIRFSSIRAFKGLEAAIVVLCELEDLHEATRDSQIYVGMSRARNRCFVVSSEDAG